MTGVVNTIELRAGSNSKQLFGPQSAPVMVQNQGDFPVALSEAITTSQSINLPAGQSITWPADTPCYASTTYDATVAIGVGATAGPVSIVEISGTATVDATGSTVALAAGSNVEISGTPTVDASGSTVSLAAGTTVDASGSTISLASGTAVEITGTTDISGTVDLAAGTEVAISSGSVSLAASTANIGTVAVNGPVALSSDTSVSISGTPTVDATGSTVGLASGTTVDASGSTVGLADGTTVELAAGTSVKISSGSVTLAASTADIGTVAVNGPVALASDTAVSISGTATVDASGSTVGVQNPTTSYPPPAAPSVTAEGTTGNTEWSYAVSVTTTDGESALGNTSGVTNGNSSLDSSNYNALALTADALPAGSSGNLVYDSNLTNAIATSGATWGEGDATRGTAAGDVNVLNPGTDSAEIVFYGTGAAFEFQNFHTSITFPALPSTTYTLSALQNTLAATVAGGSYSSFRIFDQDGNFLGQTAQGPGKNSVVSATVTTGASVTGIQVDVVPSNMVVPVGSTISFSQLQLTETSTVQPYEPGPLWTNNVYRTAAPQGVGLGLIGSTTTLAFNDVGQTAGKTNPSTVQVSSNGSVVEIAQGSEVTINGTVELAAGTAAIGTVDLAAGTSVEISSGTVDVGSISGSVELAAGTAVIGTVDLASGASVDITSGTVDIGTVSGSVGIVNPATGDGSQVVTSTVQHANQSSYTTSVVLPGGYSSANAGGVLGNASTFTKPYEVTYFISSITFTIEITTQSSGTKSSSAGVELYGGLTDNAGTIIAPTSIYNGSYNVQYGDPPIIDTVTCTFDSSAPLSATLPSGSTILGAGYVFAAGLVGCKCTVTANPDGKTNSTLSCEYI